MALLPLVLSPDPRLKQKSLPVETIDDEIRTTLSNMLETMYACEGVGLAAVQVGVMKRMLVADVTWRGDDDADESKTPLKLINPEIIKDSEEQNTHNEGCLSFPDQYAEVVRPKEITVRYLDENGKQQELTCNGLLATCIQHEIDHLDGIVFVDHISSVKRDIIMRKMKKAKKLGYYEHDHDHVHGEHCNH